MSTKKMELRIRRARMAIVALRRCGYIEETPSNDDKGEVLLYDSGGLMEQVVQ